MSEQQRELHFNAFYMASPTQSWAGLWSHPESKGLDYNKIEFWTDLAKMAESGLLDCIFIADALSMAGRYGGSADAQIRSAAMFPINDPMMSISAMAAVTKHISFGITGNTSFEPPFMLARRLSTLDHFTNGRLAWNIVTGFIPAAAKAMGMQQHPHDKRYDVADEYMEVMYKLWEGSWEEGAVVRDRLTQVFADPAKVHMIHHNSENYSCEGFHMTEPSPQRTPLLFSAGASSRGVAFAGTHAECVFMGINDFALAKKVTTKLREAAVSAGRQADDLRVFNAATVVVAPTEREVKDLVREYQAFTSEVGNLAIFSSWLDHDLAQYAPNDPIEVVESDGVRSIVDSMRASRGRGPITVGDLARFADVGGREAFIVGTPDQVCDELLRWRDEAGIDGFNLCRTVEPSSLQAFIELVVPRLQERGAYKTAYRPGTMREKLFPGRGPLLQGNHPASRFRVSTSDRIPQQHDVSVGI